MNGTIRYELWITLVRVFLLVKLHFLITEHMTKI